MILKLGIQHQGLKLYTVYTNDDPGLTLTYFTAKSNGSPIRYIMGKLLQSYIMGKTGNKGLT